jgi:hypothetical protein
MTGDGRWWGGVFSFPSFLSPGFSGYFLQKTSSGRRIFPGFVFPKQVDYPTENALFSSFEIYFPEAICEREVINQRWLKRKRLPFF